MNKFIIIGLLLLIPSLAFGSQWTTKYGLEIPSIASTDWQPAISQDILSIDEIMYQISTDLGKVSADSAFVDGGTRVYLRTATDSVMIGSTSLTPLVKTEVIGYVSCDGLRFDVQEIAPTADITTLKGAALVASRDPAGTVRLLFYNGTSWQKVSTE